MEGTEKNDGRDEKLGEKAKIGEKRSFDNFEHAARRNGRWYYYGNVIKTLPPLLNYRVKDEKLESRKPCGITARSPRDE